ncbi:SURF1 family protein [Oceaniglobus trochenteri]|uniref:SURF1 family protein n=1 Tax=Oceaniglobus trochenteri TaxID=2763260 RepID=UPI001CFFFA6F|nr:SURF1 family protein [Oceaniglobus trochenteri]
MRFAVPVLCGVVGFAVLMALGLWQVQRLAWKEGILSEITARIEAAPQAIPASPDPQQDRYLPVQARGVIKDEALRVLVSQKQVGAGYRIISPFETEGRRVMLDRGIVPVDQAAPVGHAGPVTVVGNLHWPEETDGFTPEPDLDRNIWFAREVGAMARALDTEPVLIVLREQGFDDGPVMPLPVGAEGIPNDHLGYAITWFSLALAWAGMTGFFVWRMRRPKTEG